jgi:hypothetical protein
MKKTILAALAGAQCLVGCGGPKTPLTQEQFAEVQANCGLEGASFGSASSSQAQTETNPDGSTYTVTTEHQGDPGETTIALPADMSDSDVGRAINCLSSEFSRLNAEATVQPPGNFSL